MRCKPREFHPWLACVAFKALGDAAEVRANIRAIVHYGEQGGDVNDITRKRGEGGSRG